MTNIAIIGGGIAGLALARGLAKSSHVTFDVFEGKPEFAEEGASVGLSINAQNALKHLGPDIFESFIQAGAVKEELVRHKIGEGKDAGIGHHDTPGGYCVHRQRWLEGLLQSLPKERLHVSKKLASMEESNNRVILTFTDGSKHDADAVIGGDGIHSTVRKYILGESPKQAPHFAGYWTAWNLLPSAKLIEEFGTDLLDPRSPYQVGVTGNNSFLLSQSVDDGKACGIAVAGMTGDDWDESRWEAPLTAEFLREQFKGWNPRVREAIAKCFLEHPSPRLFAQWESGICDTFAKGRVCMMGDAAHATTPWQGAGAGQALEDAAVLSALFAALSSPENVQAAFRAFDSVTRERSQKVIESSRETGRIMTGHMGIELAKVTALLEHRWDFIYNLDLDAHVGEALSTFRASAR